MLLTEFKREIIAKPPGELTDWFLRSETVEAFPTPEKYNEFQAAVMTLYPNAEKVAVAGTANWSFSLNPNKNFKTYDHRSDVDTVVVSPDDYMRFWEEIRVFHRKSYYRIGHREKQDLLRKGQNIYSGFVTPNWIPDRSNETKHRHKQNLNQLTDSRVGFRPVTMFFFRNWDEVVDYYKRGFRLAKGLLTK